ncbi:SCA7, zinc-binding domain-containing protein [Obelidium mucronatum]|nr:SCA7, zinc-binding domain-containing protein [Obelidium mucronatum]
MTAILSSDSLVIVSCKICSKPVLHSSLLGHLENCRKIHPTADLFQMEDALGASGVTALGPDGKKGAAVKRKREVTADGSATVKIKKEKKDKKAIDAEAAAASLAASAVAVGGGGGAGAVAGPAVDVAKDVKPKLPRSDSQTIKEKGPKPKGPIDYDKHCGVIAEPGGLPCARSITCKIHSVSAKRAVVGRTHLYDVLLADYQSKSRATNPGLSIPGLLGDSMATSVRKQTTAIPMTLQLGPMHIPTELEAAELFDVIRNHQPQPLLLLTSIGTRNVGCMLREIREKRMGGSGAGSFLKQQ